MAGIILKSQFSTSQFSGYLDYINDEKSKHEDDKTIQHLEHIKSIHSKRQTDKQEGRFSRYVLDYMNNNHLRKKDSQNQKEIIKRTRGSFNELNDHINAEDFKKLKQDFDQAEKNGSVNYQDIISFDNDFLEKHGLYDSKTDTLNEAVIKNATRKMMTQLIKDEALIPENTRWVGNIHYDTDNIHIHISTTELENTRAYTKSETYQGEVKGARSEATLSNMKSAFANQLLDNQKYLEKVTEHRNELYEKVGVTKATAKEQVALIQLVRRLPEEKHKWQYNHKNVKHLQPLIDRYTNEYMKNHHHDLYEDYHKSVKETTDFYREAYGENSKADQYQSHKEKEINMRMGNKLLKELKRIDDDKVRDIQKKDVPSKYFKDPKTNKTFYPYKKQMVTKRDMYRLNRALDNQAETYQAEIQHAQLERKIEQTKYQEANRGI